jgi:hypothetical protein
MYVAPTRPLLFKSKSLSISSSNDVRLYRGKEEERTIHSDEDTHEKKEMNFENDTSTVRVPMKRKNPLRPAILRSTSSSHSNTNYYRSPLKMMNPSCSAVDEDDDDGDDAEQDHNVNDVVNDVPIKRRNSFIPTALRGVTLSPKVVFGKPKVGLSSSSSLSNTNKRGKPPLIRNLSFSTSTDTWNTETDDSDNHRSLTNSPTSSASSSSASSNDVRQSNERSSIDTMLYDTTAGSSCSDRGDIQSFGQSCTKSSINYICSTTNQNSKQISFVRSIISVVCMFFWHHLNKISTTFRMKAIITTVWMTLFDIMVEAVSISLEIISYVILVVLRIFETTMLWFVQQVYIRRMFIYLYETLKGRRKNHDNKNDVVLDDTNIVPTNSIDKGNRRPIRFLHVPKDIVRRRHTCSNKD